MLETWTLIIWILTATGVSIDHIEFRGADAFDKCIEAGEKFTKKNSGILFDYYGFTCVKG